MIRTLFLLLLFTLVSCTTPLELGERRYREGDRVAALEIWRSVGHDSLYYRAAQRRVKEVEDESARLVALFKKRGRYYERKGRLAESILNYRLALKLRPQDRATLDHVQKLVRSLAAQADEARNAYAEAYEALVRSLAAQADEARKAYTEAYEVGELTAAAKAQLATLRTLDPFDPRLATDERQLEDTLQGVVRPLLAEGRRAFSSGSYGSAENAFRSVLQLDPDNETARGNLSFIAQIRDVEEATAETDLPVAEPPQIYATEQQIRAEGLFQNAVRAESKGKLFKAAEFDMRALEKDPKHAGARAHLAELRRRMPSAEELIRQGQDDYQQEDLEAALDEWRKALLIDPGNAQALEYVARAERLLENLERLRAEPDVGAEEK